MPIAKATTNDITALAALINSGYRGEFSKKGWTSEADLLQGELRTDITSLNELMQLPAGTFLKYTTEEGIAGCVYLEKRERGLYLGMLTVSPLLQAGGIGRLLMEAAEKHALENNCAAIFMNVISVRHELIAWYERMGYEKTGETTPMPLNEKYGIPAQPLFFLVLEKKMRP